MDHQYMELALQLASHALPWTAPNPAVGCVLVRDGEIVGSGATQAPGGNHAEVEALVMAGDKAKGATAYVTLEPCAHHGKTPPCTQALIDAGVAQVVVACLDPDPRVNGQGISQLEEAGIHVSTGTMEAEAKALNRGFFSKTLRGRPWVILKTALSVDGKVATATGESQWISGEVSRREVHELRRVSDAVLIGAGTARADNPRLTVRVNGQPVRVPWRVVVTSACDLAPDLNLFSDEFTDRTIILTGADRSDMPGKIASSAVQWVRCAVTSDQRVDLADGLAHLAALGINTVLCEGGPSLSADLCAHGLVDELICYRAPILLGGDGVSAWNSLGVEQLAQVRALLHLSTGASGNDVREHYLSLAGADIAEPDGLVRLQEILSRTT